MRRHRRPKRLTLPITAQPASFWRGAAKVLWKSGKPSIVHASWCYCQPPAPAGPCSCWRSLPARALRSLREKGIIG